MKVKVNIKLLVLFIVISGGLSFYHLINPDFKLASVNIEDIVLVFSAMWGLYTWINLLHRPNPKFAYWPWMIGILFLIIASSWQSLNLFNQSFWLGFRAQRNIFVWALLYFPLSKSMCYDKFTLENVKNMIRLIGIIELVLFISQYFLTGKISFLYANMGTRYESVRYYFQPVLLDLLLFVELDNLLKIKGKNKIASIIIIVTIIFEVMVVQKFRLTSLSLILCCAFGVLIVKRGIKIKFVYFLLAFIALGVILNTTMFQDLINTFMFKETSTLGIREAGRELYIQNLTYHPIFGGGYPHEQSYAACQAAGFFKNIFLVDNGVFGLTYIYGGVGIVWIITLWFRQLKNGYNLYKKNGMLLYLLFPLFFVITGINEVHWFWQNGFMIFVLFIVMQEKEVALNKKTNH